MDQKSPFIAILYSWHHAITFSRPESSLLTFVFQFAHLTSNLERTDRKCGFHNYCNKSNSHSSLPLEKPEIHRFSWDSSPSFSGSKQGTLDMATPSSRQRAKPKTLAPWTVTWGFGDVWVSEGSRAGGYLGDPSWHKWRQEAETRMTHSRLHSSTVVHPGPRLWIPFGHRDSLTSPQGWLGEGGKRHKEHRIVGLGWDPTLVLSDPRQSSNTLKPRGSACLCGVQGERTVVASRWESWLTQPCPWRGESLPASSLPAPAHTEQLKANERGGDGTLRSEVAMLEHPRHTGGAQEIVVERGLTWKVAMGASEGTQFSALIMLDLQEEEPQSGSGRSQETSPGDVLYFLPAWEASAKTHILSSKAGKWTHLYILHLTGFPAPHLLGLAGSTLTLTQVTSSLWDPVSSHSETRIHALSHPPAELLRRLKDNSRSRASVTANCCAHVRWL